MAHRLKQLEYHTSSNSAIDSAAATVFRVVHTPKQLPLLTQQYPNLDLPTAYKVTAAVRDLRVANGELVAGRKVGFTNRTAWDQQKVDAPIWGYMYDTTVLNLSDLSKVTEKGSTEYVFSLSGIEEPRAEPEIVFGLAKTPTPDMDDDSLLSCIEWVAHGFEIVHTLFLGLKSTAPDTVATLGMHAKLLIGERYDCRSKDYETWKRDLAGLQIKFYRDGKLVDTGSGSDVMDSPLASLRSLIELLEKDELNPQVAAGEIITTGALTKALPAKKGEVWHTELSGVNLSDIRVRFV